MSLAQLANSPQGAFERYLNLGCCSLMSYRRERPESLKPGGLLRYLSVETREALKDLTSKDFQHRIDWILIKEPTAYEKLLEEFKNYLFSYGKIP